MSRCFSKTNLSINFWQPGQVYSFCPSFLWRITLLHHSKWCKFFTHVLHWQGAFVNSIFASSFFQASYTLKLSNKFRISMKWCRSLFFWLASSIANQFFWIKIQYSILFYEFGLWLLLMDFWLALFEDLTASNIFLSEKYFFPSLVFPKCFLNRLS